MLVKCTLKSLKVAVSSLNRVQLVDTDLGGATGPWLCLIFSSDTLSFYGLHVLLAISQQDNCVLTTRGGRGGSRGGRGLSRGGEWSCDAIIHESCYNQQLYYPTTILLGARILWL